MLRYLCPFDNCCLSCFCDRQILIKPYNKLQKHNGSQCFSCGMSHLKKPHPVTCRYIFRNCPCEVALAVSPEMLVRLTLPLRTPFFFFSQWKLFLGSKLIVGKFRSKRFVFHCRKFCPWLRNVTTDNSVAELGFEPWSFCHHTFQEIKGKRRTTPDNNNNKKQPQGDWYWV